MHGQGERQPALQQQGVQAPTGSSIGSGGDIPSSGVGTEQPKDVGMDKPIGAKGTWLRLGVRGCKRERVCLCTGKGVCPGLLLAVRSRLPRFAASWDNIPGSAEHGRGRQSRGDLVPASPSLLIHSLQPLEGHKSHLGSCTLAFCVAVVWSGLVFHPAHILCFNACATN